LSLDEEKETLRREKERQALNQLEKARVSWTLGTVGKVRREQAGDCYGDMNPCQVENTCLSLTTETAGKFRAEQRNIGGQSDSANLSFQGKFDT
jgi:hypothetical protein